MKRHPSFRPCVTRLESRWLPTASAYPDVFRNAVQQSYVAQADTKTNEVVFLGDSITFNWGTATRPAPGSTVFTANFARLGVANFGIIGDTTQNLLDRVQTGDLNGQPKVAVVMIGFNDLYGGSTPAQTAEGVTSVVQAIQAESPSTRILLLGVLPSQVAAVNPEIQQLDTLISGLGKEPGVTYLNPGALFGGTNGAANPSLLQDVVHPDAAGYQVLANAIEGTILGLLGDSTPVSTAPTLAVSPKTSASQSTLTPVDSVAPVPISSAEIVPLVTSVDTSIVNPSTTQSDRPKTFATELIDVRTG